MVHTGNEDSAAGLANEVKREKQVFSELLGSMRKVTNFTSFLIIPLGAALFLEAVFLRNAPAGQAVVSSAAALLGMLPKGLVLLISDFPGSWSYPAGTEKILVQNIYALETLAHVDTLCLDKTGTITDGKPRVYSAAPMSLMPQRKAEALVKSYLAACQDNNATFRALRRPGLGRKCFSSRSFGSPSHRKENGEP